MFNSMPRLLRDGDIQIDIIANDQRIVAAEFQRNLLQSFGCPYSDFLPVSMLVKAILLTFGCFTNGSPTSARIPLQYSITQVEKSSNISAKQG
jgi:hypothetical protein